MDPGGELDRSQRRSVVDNAIYVDGRRTDDPASLAETYELLRQRKGMAWIGLYRPTRADILSVARRVRAAPAGGRRCDRSPSTSQAGAVRRHCCSLCSARLAISTRRRRSNSVSCTSFVGPDYRGHDPARRVTGSGQGSSPVRGQHWRCCASVQKRCCTRSWIRSSMSTARWWPGLENDIDEIEDQLFSGDPAVSRRIYDLTREVIEFQRTTRPLLNILAFAGGRVRQIQRRCRTTPRSARRPGPCGSGWWIGWTPSERCCRTR